ncbi:hypothetical protein SKAU_G00320450 [Synaphobranchus kaupii]|uniref:B30.2/SPRY domain-containing protein n=1 Tax=Synaphobranchus kaupii TaxID=118154 RepID=A0A9Q1ENM6_SYNKA|nr:hypothetical protein SKAU_G00320450 [Synaphobranchus kaupii]
MCRESVCERCYWEAEWSVSQGWGRVHIAVTYKAQNKAAAQHAAFGQNKTSWILECDYGDGGQSYSVCHYYRTHTPAPPSPYRRAGAGADGEGVCVYYRVGVCVDRPAGTLSFYSVSDSDTLTLLHTFHTHFTEHTPLCPGFHVYDSSVSLCQLE